MRANPLLIHTMASLFDNLDNNARHAVWAAPLAVLLCLYYWRWGRINGEIWKKMKDARVARVWALVATAAFSVIILAFLVVVSEGLDAYGWVGYSLYWAGTLAWPIAIGETEASFDSHRYGKYYEPLALSVTSLGIIMWATATPEYWWFAAIGAFYSVVVDTCWYMQFVASPRISTRISGFAAWSGFVAMLHFAFASFVIAENIRATDAFTPDIRLMYNRWVRPEGEDTCTDATCVVYSVSTNYGSVDVGVIVALFSWISGTNHWLTYLGLFGGSEFVATQVALGTGSEPHTGNIIRTLDWTMSASLMMLINLFLFESPGNIATLTAVLTTTGLVMIVGWGSEVLHGLGRPVGKWFLYATSGVLFILVWVPLFMILQNIFDTGVTQVVEGGVTLPLERNKPPIEVQFFIFWLFATFMTFPIVHAFKLLDDVTMAFKYEILFIILSLISKLPLLAVFYGGILSRRSTIEAFKVDDGLVNITNIGSVVEPPTDSEGRSRLFASIGVGCAIAVVTAAFVIGWYRRIVFSGRFGCYPVTTEGKMLSGAAGTYTF